MSALTGTPWELTCTDPTPLMLKAQAQLERIIGALREGRLAGDLDKHSTKRIRSAILAEATTQAARDFEIANGLEDTGDGPYYDPDLFESTLSLALSGVARLEQQRSEASEASAVVKVVVPPRRNELHAATFLHPNPFMAFAIDRALDEAVVSCRRQTEWKASPVSVLVHLLASRSALCSSRLIIHALVAIAERERIHSDGTTHWFHISVDIAGTTCRRRVLLDHTTVAAIVPAAQALSACVSRRRSTTVKSIRALALGDFRDLLSRILPHDQCSRRHGCMVEDYLRSVATLVHLKSCVLVASHSAGMIAASSLQASCHARLQRVTITSESEGTIGSAPPSATAGQRPHCAGDSPTDGDLVGEGVVAEIRRVVSRAAVIDADALKWIRDDYPPSSTAHVVADWIAHLTLDTTEGHGKQRQPGTVNYYRAMMVSRLLHSLPGSLADIDSEELADCYREITETASSPAHRARIISVLRMFHRFGVDAHALPSVAGLFPTGGGGSYDVSARIVVEADYKKALDSLRAPTRSAAKSVEHLMARCLLILCFRFGLRRAEALGLSLAEINNADPDGLVTIRDNDARKLKTSNANRRFPLKLLEARELEDLRLLARHSCPNGDNGQAPHGFLFFQSPMPEGWEVGDHPAVGIVVEHLRRVTGDRSLHLHHLRHSFATLQLLGTLACDLDPSAQALLPDWIRDAMKGARRFQLECGALVGSHGFRGTAVSHAMGHGSDSTTYEHYVHALETIAWATLAGIRRSGYGHPDGTEGRRSRHSDERLGAWLLGKSPDSRPLDGNWSLWLRRALLEAGIPLVVHAPSDDCNPSAPRLDLPTALALEGASIWEDVPCTPAAEQVAIAFFKRVAAIPLEQLKSCVGTFKYLRKRQTARGWSALKTSKAREIEQFLVSIDRDTFALDMRVVRYSKGKRSFEMLDAEPLAKWLHDGKGITELRIRQPAEVGTDERSRHFRTIFWCLEALCQWIEVEVEVPVGPGLMA